jgi:hypothetical protein
MSVDRRGTIWRRANLTQGFVVVDAKNGNLIRHADAHPATGLEE